MDNTEFKISTIVMGVFFTEKFNILNLYELLPCKLVDFTYKKGKKIPFFNDDKSIISLQMEKKSRGIRNGGGFKNALCLDFQVNNKNMHIKITNNKFHITGAKSYEMGIDSAEKCLSLIKKIENEWKDFFILNYQDKYILCVLAFNFLKHDMNLLMFDREEVYERFKKLDIKFYKYANIILLLMSFSYEYNTIFSFSAKIDMILNLSISDKFIFNSGDEIKLKSPVIYNGIYNYKLKFTENIYLSDLSKKINNGNDRYIVSYHNTLSPHKIDISKQIFNKDNEPLIPKKYGKIPSHKFTISSTGSIKQTSPTSTEDAYNEYLLIKNRINQYIEEIENNII